MSLFDTFFLLFTQGYKTAKIALDLCTVYRVDFITGRMEKQWFSRFKERIFELTDSQTLRLLADLFGLTNTRSLKKTTPYHQKMASPRLIASRHHHSLGTVQKHTVIEA